MSPMTIVGWKIGHAATRHVNCDHDRIHMAVRQSPVVAEYPELLVKWHGNLRSMIHVRLCMVT